MKNLTHVNDACKAYAESLTNGFVQRMTDGTNDSLIMKVNGAYVVSQNGKILMRTLHYDWAKEKLEYIKRVRESNHKT